MTHVLGPRAFHSQLLCEQASGAGYAEWTTHLIRQPACSPPSMRDIFGVPFSLIPFKGRKLARRTSSRGSPKARSHGATRTGRRSSIRFPSRGGLCRFAEAQFYHRKPCDYREDTIRSTWTTPTAARSSGPIRGLPDWACHAHGGFGFDLVDRQEYYDSVHPQTIAFEIAREVVRIPRRSRTPGRSSSAGKSRSAPFPQVLRIVQVHIGERRGAERFASI